MPEGGLPGAIDPHAPPVLAQAGPPLVASPTGDHAPAGVEREFTVAARSQASMIFRRFLQHRLAVVSVFVFVAVVIFAFFGGVFWHYHFMDRTNDFSVGPSLKHPFGTDDIGHDELSLVIRGAQRSLEVAMFVAIVATAVGTIYGAVSGYYRGATDNLMMRFVDLVLTLPLIAIAAVLGHKFEGTSIGNGWLGLAIVLAALSWAPIARVVRGVVLSLREREFVEAAEAMGATTPRIIFRHLLPNSLGPIIVNATIYVAVAILAETALSFIGFGVQPPDTSLGALVSNGQTAADTRPWLFYLPGAFIILIALSINFIGDGLRDAFDPQQNRVRA